MTDEESMFSACVFPGWLKSVCFSFLILHPVCICSWSYVPHVTFFSSILTFRWYSCSVFLLILLHIILI
jgi:hypothetical protein